LKSAVSGAASQTVIATSASVSSAPPVSIAPTPRAAPSLPEPRLIAITVAITSTSAAAPRA